MGEKHASNPERKGLTTFHLYITFNHDFTGTWLILFIDFPGMSPTLVRTRCCSTLLMPATGPSNRSQAPQAWLLGRAVDPGTWSSTPRYHMLTLSMSQSSLLYLLCLLVFRPTYLHVHKQQDSPTKIDQCMQVSSQCVLICYPNACYQ